MSELLPSVALAAADGDGVVKRTRRPALSCMECRMRKVKCNREKPCGGCIKIGSSRCTYRPSRAAARANFEQSPSSISGSRGSHQSSTHSSLHEPAPIYDQYNATNVLSEHTRAHPRPSNAKEPRVVTEPRTRVGATSTMSISVTDGGAFRTPIINSTASEHGTGPLKGSIADHPGSFQKSKYFGQSHWMNALEPYKALGDANTTVNPATDRVEVNKSTELHKTMNELKSMARVIKSSRMLLPTIAPEALNSLPSKVICDILVRCYFRTFEGVFRVLHRPSFQKEYDEHWLSRSQSKISVLLKIMLVCAIGVPFYTGLDQPQLRVVCSRWIQAAETWLAAPHAKSRLNMAGIQIQILVLLAKQVCNVEGDHVWISAGSLLRTAMYLGLHREPAHFAKIKPFHAEMRRRLWTTVVELTVQSSLDMGMPPMLSEHDYDTKPPSNLDDCDMSEEDDDLEYVQPVDVYTDCSIQIAFAESLPIRLEIVRLINSLQFDLGYRECLRIGTELAALCGTKICFFRKAFKEGCNITPFQIKLLDSLVRRFVLGLHRPFFAKAKDDPQYHYSRKICLDASLAIFAPATASLAGVDDDWTLMTYRAVGFFKSLILYAISTIYFELNTQMEEHRKLSSLMAPLVSEVTAEQTPSLSPQTQMLYDALARAHRMALLRLKNGETNPKGVVFFACALARIDAFVTGTNAEAKVLEAARASVVEMRGIMADVYEHEHGESIDLRSSRTRDRGHGRGDGADDVTGRHLPTGTETNADVGVEMSADGEFGVDSGSQSFLSGGMDFNSQFLQDPEWFFNNNDWTGMPGDTMDFGEL